MRSVTSVYLDTSALLDLMNESGGVEHSHVRRLRRASCNWRKIRVIISIIQLEELCAPLKNKPDKVKQQVSFLLSISAPANFVKEPKALFKENVGAVLLDQPLPSPFLAEDWVKEALVALQDPSTDLGLSLLSALESAGRQNEEFQESMKLLRQDFRQHFPDRRGPGFCDAWRVLAEPRVVGLAEAAGFSGQAAQARMEALLDNKAVRLLAGLRASRCYAQWIEERSPKNGDLRDDLHVLSACAADVLVSNDRELRRLTGRIPDLRLGVLSLEEFLQTI